MYDFWRLLGIVHTISTIYCIFIFYFYIFFCDMCSLALFRELFCWESSTPFLSISVLRYLLSWFHRADQPNVTPGLTT